MENMESGSSLDMGEVINMNEQCDVFKETELWKENVDLIEKSNLGNTMSSSYEISAPTNPETKLSPGSLIRRRGLTGKLHLLNVEHDGADNPPYLFDRHAPSRISTSPTLRRLRKNTSSVSQIAQLQDNAENIRTDKQMPQISVFLSMHPELPSRPQHCCLPSSSGIYSNTVTQVQHSTSVNPTANLLDNNDFSDTQTVQHSRDNNLSPECEGNDSQQYSQALELHKSSRSAVRRHSSVVVSLPGLEMFPGDLLISDSAAQFLYQSASLQNSESKRTWWPFAKKGINKDKQKQMAELEYCLSTLTIKMSECDGYKFHNVKDKTWHEMLKMYQLEPQATGDQLDTKKKEAVWELFTTECNYFLDHLLVLKMIFMDTLKYLQTKELLPDVDPELLFANLEELNQVTLSFATSLFSTMEDHLFGRTPSLDFISVLTKYFQGNLCQSHQIYCLTYTSAIFYLEKLKKREDFGTYLKWCEQNKECKRLHLAEMLVAPLHKLTRYPLLLKNIWKNTEAAEKVIINSLKEKVETSIRDLEGKVKWLDNFQKFKQLQEIIIWPSLWDQEKRHFVPESLKYMLRDNSHENILSPTKRSLIFEGRLTLSESMRFTDVYLFLFDDLLMITKPNRYKKRFDLSLTPASSFFSLELKSLLEEGGNCIVLGQPIPLDRMMVKNIDSFHITALGLRNAFLIQHENRYQQCIGAYLLQAQTEVSKKTWISQMETTITNYIRNNISKPSFFNTLAESAEI
ncbi:PREDICTED: pleckstrin homology domain-containing family G member 7 isoform X1 [Thamnophis sirtalis]|uniref:Pleckstrin homology domain-containing family G member 7 isoform X1 n=2 Tax=Thamnophis sirtalis TaxID=35019 RepID=A0A6I9X8S3_9SAUR|nr:PREDICTED: pleckstrin homology domain-containing family G member 7 isoform X1 [Thamnophis sirtalis]XP_013911959.1 PREDICTED: pleckstrin homology domain-containing family G member 7 isoform X1 [Thamnophis sirtalis]